MKFPNNLHWDSDVGDWDSGDVGNWDSGDVVDWDSGDVGVFDPASSPFQVDLGIFLVYPVQWYYDVYDFKFRPF